VKAHDLLKIYEEDSFIKTLLEEIKLKRIFTSKVFQVV
jgi:hypothetical protein